MECELETQQGQAYAACGLANLCSHLICREGFHLSNGIQHVPGLLASEAGEVRVQALRLLVAVAGEPKVRARAGPCVPPLIALLADTEWMASLGPELTEQAALALLHLCEDSPANRALLLAHKGLPCAVRLLQSSRPAVAQAAAHLLALLSQDEQARGGMCEEETIARHTSPPNALRFRFRSFTFAFFFRSFFFFC